MLLSLLTKAHNIPRGNKLAQTSNLSNLHQQKASLCTSRTAWSYCTGRLAGLPRVSAPHRTQVFNPALSWAV